MTQGCQSLYCFHIHDTGLPVSALFPHSRHRVASLCTVSTLTTQGCQSLHCFHTHDTGLPVSALFPHSRHRVATLCTVSTLTTQGCQSLHCFHTHDTAARLESVTRKREKRGQQYPTQKTYPLKAPPDRMMAHETSFHGSENMIIEQRGK